MDACVRLQVALMERVKSDRVEAAASTRPWSAVFGSDYMGYDPCRAHDGKFICLFFTLSFSLSLAHTQIHTADTGIPSGII